MDTPVILYLLDHHMCGTEILLQALHLHILYMYTPAHHNYQLQGSTLCGQPPQFPEMKSANEKLGTSSTHTSTHPVGSLMLPDQ